MMRPIPKPVTQHDLAALVGVSQRTVSRCFTDPEAVTPAICAKVLEAAQRNGYRPNHAARMIRGGRSDCVSLLRDVRAPDHYIHDSLLWSVHGTLRKHRMHLALGDLPGGADDQGRGAIPPSDGVLVPCHNGLSEPPSVLAKRLSLPAVWINTPEMSDSVCPDDRSAGRRAVEHLIGLGHRRIAFAGSLHQRAAGRACYCNGRARLEGYQATMVAAGLKPTLLATDEEDMPDTSIRVYRAALGASDRPTALVVCRKQLAREAMYAAHVCCGLQVPRDLSLVTFADESPRIAPRLTAWIMPWESMGCAAVDLLLGRLRDPGKPAESRLIPMELADGATCAPPSRDA